MVRTLNKKKNVGEVISNKNYDNVRQELMVKAKQLYCELQDNFGDLAKTAKGSNVKLLLNDFAKEAGQDCKELDAVLSGSSTVNVETEDRHYGIFSHLLSAEESSLSDEEKAIVKALKISDNLRNVFSIMSSEYKDKKIKGFFETLSKHEVHRKNELEQLYEELIVRGQW